MPPGTPGTTPGMLLGTTLGMTPATARHPATVQGTILQNTAGIIVLGLPGTDYQLHLMLDADLPPDYAAPTGATVRGTIHANAKRVDVVRTGGRYIEPVYGRPRRLQGSIIATEPASNTLTVQCACPFICTLDVNQKASLFEIGQLVSFDIERGATFKPIKP